MVVATCFQPLNEIINYADFLCEMVFVAKRPKPKGSYMFICTELIEETGIPPGLIFGLARRTSSLGRKFTPMTEL